MDKPSTYRGKTQIAARMGITTRTLESWAKEPEKHWQMGAVRQQEDGSWLMDEVHYLREMQRSTDEIGESQRT